jgi:hypothetical protein
MSSNLDIFVNRQGADQYTLVARKYGIVIRTNDAQAGLKELEARVEDVRRDMMNAGVEPEQVDASSNGTKQGRGSGGGQGGFGILLAVVSATLVPWLALFLLTIPIVTTFTELKVATQDARSILRGDVKDSAHASANWYIRAGDIIDQLTPTRKEELRSATRKIVNGLAPITEELRPLFADPTSQKRQP